MMKYRGYTATVEFDADAGVLHGRVADITDVVTFEAESVQDIEREFHVSLDEYLDFCRELGREPNRPFSGKLVVRMDPDLHRAAAATARQSRQSLNTFITAAIQDAVRKQAAAA